MLATRNMKRCGPGHTITFVKTALGFLHSRTNLSPFTKDFRGEAQHDEYLTIFPWPCFGEAAYDKRKPVYVLKPIYQ